jgi:hypothetical protein
VLSNLALGIINIPGAFSSMQIKKFNVALIGF